MPGSSRNERVLAKAVRDLVTDWEETASGWRDQARREFEKDIIEALVPSVKGAATAMQQIGEVLDRAVRECC